MYSLYCFNEGLLGRIHRENHVADLALTPGRGIELPRRSRSRPAGGGPRRETGVPAVGQGQVRVQVDRALVVPLRVRPLPGGGHEVGQRVVRVGDPRVQFDRLARRRPRLGQILVRIVDAAPGQTAIDVGEVGIGGRVGRIDGDSLNEILARLLAVLLPPFARCKRPFSSSS